MTKDSFGARGTLEVHGKTHRIASIPHMRTHGFEVEHLPFALRILLENLIRYEDGSTVTKEDIEALAGWKPNQGIEREIAFRPARVLMQDFTGVPAVVDLAAMRDAMEALGGDPTRINPLQPAEMVIDHSVQVDAFGSPDAMRINSEREFERNSERYSFLKWGQATFHNFRVVPPETGIVHQVNLEFLARCVMVGDDGYAYPDTLVGTDSHTTMVNGLGVLGWGVGGIEAEAAMLGQPVSMLIPEVVGVRLTGQLPAGSTATDLVLRITEMLRKHGVVGKFVEFMGKGLAHLPLADRATIANMAPEYGATCGIFPFDDATTDYLRLTGRSEESIRLVETYARAQGLWFDASTPEPKYSSVVDLDMGTVRPSLAGPSRPQDRVLLEDVPNGFRSSKTKILTSTKEEDHDHEVTLTRSGQTFALGNGSVVIAAITSCTNTSNPSVMVAAGLLAKKAVERGLESKPWVKTSLGPGSKVVTEYLEGAGLTPYLEQLGFHVVGYGCTTCIGNSGPLPKEIESAIDEGRLVVSSVLSGNRNFEGRVHAKVRSNYLASPPLVVAYALAGNVQVDVANGSLGQDSEGKEVYLRDIWPTAKEVQAVIDEQVTSAKFRHVYANVFDGPPAWQAIEAPVGATYDWKADSTYIKHPPYFEGMGMEPSPVQDIQGARVLGLFGDSITTDHISPAGSIGETSPAGKYLKSLGVAKADFNSYGSRRGNHEVMMRGTFANVRIKNKLVPGVEGGVTTHMPSGTQMSIFDAAMKYKADGIPSIVLGGKEYGTGSSRDWAGKGPALLGVRAVLVESYERIHRSNLVGMGVLPLQFKDGDSIDSLGLTGQEVFSIDGMADKYAKGHPAGGEVTVRAERPDGSVLEFPVRVRIDTPEEANYYLHGGILTYVLRRLAKA
ncbi:MAG: aconitate hydratase AcnA [Planctomycetes bacterium]|nr:aconitate hydratase AcnA [Planctomycetota bacterium]MCB9909742.1 aconitate hydratase AcnA [Planctomycetota bacterium]HPF13792.1 aconitate hydratase AcnA [Planctomycetota bacterium]